MDILTGHPETLETIRHLATRWAGADMRLLRQVFPLLVRGKPVRVAAIAQAADVPESAMVDALRRGRASLDSEGRVIELSGLMLQPTMHRLEIEDVACFSCCALLAHLVPLLIGKPARVESVDPVSRRLVRLSTGPSGVTAADPPGAVGCLVATVLDEVMEDVATNLCTHVHHFASGQYAAEFAAEDSRRYVVSMSHLHEAARMLHREVWS